MISAFDTITIKGRKEFIVQTIKALALLQENSHYPKILAHIKIIKESSRSGMQLFGEVPIYEVGKRTWGHSAVWYASTIAHDAYHAILYSKAIKKKNGNDWHGKEAERKCLKFQEGVLKELGADRVLVEYLEKIRVDPVYQGDSESVKDYFTRNW